uniref:RNA polymerase alpha subunit n=1 Tax=Tillandsia ixioides TaxID=294063 RepID=UPI00211475FB|nr:RNA polymerase alpha subunit [Tillandsia ixioides]YP_010905000.1 RNA polymerase alpha subunit [Tillandsia aeranthos]YP_010912567.1 RNA polymerase alpha subunit [Tillandsia neglecta]UTA94887.1 RNA polymerase alpha subunit [Tillandsia ixioides]WIL81014.1 RNA polymerase alpha subunit [Tillandsia aeranthos]WIL88757.1 RNA polymerase alpha subunit [Tillandsia neglecta]
MVREEVAGSTRTLQWKCVESRVDSKRLYYGRFILSPLMKGQADTIGIAMRRALLGEIEGTCITRAKSKKVPHEYSTIVGIEESVHEILQNLKEIVLRSNLYGVRDASICVRGPRYVTAQDIISPPSVEIVDTTQHIANLTEPIDLCIGLQIKRDRGYRMEPINDYQDGSYPIDAVFMPVRNANHSIHSYGNGNEKQEILFIEIWTNGSLTPKEALYEASRNLIDLFIPFLYAEEEDINFEENKNRFTLPFLTFQDRLTNLKKNKKGIPLNCIFIDQLELPSRTYNCLKRSNIHTLLDLLSNSQEDLMRIEYFRMEDVKQILDTLHKHFAIDLPKNKFSF